MTMPTKTQVNRMIQDHAKAVGAVNVRASEVMLAIESKFPNLDWAQYKDVQNEVATLAAAVASEGALAIWQ